MCYPNADQDGVISSRGTRGGLRGGRGRGERGRPRARARACGRGESYHRAGEQEPPVGIPVVVENSSGSPRARLRPRKVVIYNYMLAYDFDSE